MRTSASAADTFTRSARRAAAQTVLPTSASSRATSQVRATVRDGAKRGRSRREFDDGFIGRSAAWRVLRAGLRRDRQRTITDECDAWLVHGFANGLNGHVSVGNTDTSLSALAYARVNRRG